MENDRALSITSSKMHATVTTRHTRAHTTRPWTGQDGYAPCPPPPHPRLPFPFDEEALTLTCPVMSSGPSSVCRNIVLCHLTGTISEQKAGGGGGRVSGRANSAGGKLSVQREVRKYFALGACWQVSPPVFVLGGVGLRFSMRWAGAEGAQDTL